MVDMPSNVAPELKAGSFVAGSILPAFNSLKTTISPTFSGLGRNLSLTLFLASMM